MEKDNKEEKDNNEQKESTDNNDNFYLKEMKEELNKIKLFQLI